MSSSIRFKEYFACSLFIGLVTIFSLFDIGKVAAQAPIIQPSQTASLLARTIPGNGHGLTASTTNWTMYGFSPNHTGTNPYENILNTANVSHLVLKWTASTNYYAQSSQPAVVNGIIYYGSLDTIYAFNAQTGATVWTVTFQGDLASYVSPVVVNGIVYLCPMNAGMYALNAQTGAVLWHEPVAPNGTAYAAPTLANGVLYEGWDNGRLYAFNAKTGAILWNVPMYTLYASPAFAKGILYVTADTHLYALNPKTGATLWSVQAGGYNNTAPTVANGIVYVGGGSGTFSAFLYAYNAKTGAPIWSDNNHNGVPGITSPSSLALANGILYLYSGDVYAFNAQTGAFLWHTTTGSGAILFGSSPVVANGVVYVGAYNSKVYAFNAQTGATLWSYTTGNSIASLPVVINGMVYIGSSDSKLYAFHLPGL